MVPVVRKMAAELRRRDPWAAIGCKLERAQNPGTRRGCVLNNLPGWLFFAWPSDLRQVGLAVPTLPQSANP